MFGLINMQSNIYVDILDFQKNKQKIYDYASKYYGDGVITELGVPSLAPLEVPRMICISKHNHSQLLITGNMMQIVTQFDDKYSFDYDKCIKYVQERTDWAIECLHHLNVKIIYSGVTVSANSLSGNAKQALLDTFFKVDLNSEPCEIAGKFTFVNANKYYINIGFSNIDNENDSYINVMVDINDKYRFNHNREEYPFSDDNVMHDIFALHSDFFFNKADTFITKGVML